MNRLFPMLWVAWFTCAATQGAERPNVVLILAHDMGYNDLACYGALGLLD